ncbi:MAG: Asp-tRNA(Asn)/Glu-tRNA(Gln) amidotransferase subunit GatB [Fibromonadales bacterium]|nr:Asp-tRNA(Asn)/Glu-tRNA(Gln) amidotransferase subunit GatB [Fibromonadales bacterium]
MSLEMIIGIEVHAELNTKSKIFCTCSTAFGGEANSKVCPVCSGQPGSLPKLNEAVVECAVKLGLVLGCTINRNCKFDRKNYFYPDLPKAYQISQLYFPICTDGKLEIDINGSKKSIGIREIHIEEDAGKLIHAPSENGTYIDYNRAGVPLLEIVTNPDFRSAQEVVAFIERLRETMLYLEICDCKMQEGSLRADVNLSIREQGNELGTRTETKNMNSLRAISRAIEYERERQLEIINGNGKVVQQTRRWDEDKSKSFPMRSKENAQDYRYFPEPDLQPLEISEERLNEIRKNIPELAQEKRGRYMSEYGISSHAAGIICASKNMAGLFEELAQKSKEPVEAANLITGELMRLINNFNADMDTLTIDVDKLAFLIYLVVNGKINRGVYKDIVGEVFTNNVDPEKYIAEKGLLVVSDDDAIIAAVNEALSKNSAAVGDFAAGKEKAFTFLMGQAMKSLGGKGDPVSVKRVLLKVLNEKNSCE